MSGYFSGEEIPVTFTNKGMQLVGMLHRPETGDKPPAIVFCHGCTASRTEAHWLFVKLARRFADMGIMSLRFDFRHSGESEGTFEEMILSGEISDAIRAFGYLSDECGADPSRIGFLGMSMGGAIAAIVSGRLKERVRSAILLNPVGNPSKDLAYLADVRAVDASRFPVEFNSYLFGKAFVDELPRIRPLAEIADATCPVLVINGTEDKTIAPSRAREYLETLRAHGIPSELHIIKGANHSFSSAAWEREVMDGSGRWLEKTLIPLSPEK